MGLSTLGSKVIEGALVLTALTGCASPEVRGQIETVSAENEKIPQIPSGKKPIPEVPLQPLSPEQQALKERIISAIKGVADNYEVFQKKQDELAVSARKKDFVDWDTAGRRVWRCREAMNEKIRAVLEKLERLITPELRKALGNCGSSGDEKTLACNADVLVRAGKGVEYAESIEESVFAIAGGVECLEKIQP